MNISNARVAIIGLDYVGLPGSHKASSINVAEAAKVIENTQGDLSVPVFALRLWISAGVPWSICSRRRASSSQ